MLSDVILLFAEFFKIGLFSIGGGLATIPFLYDLADKYAWFDRSMVVDMIAVSEATPGAIGINMATFTGFQNLGVFGGALATAGIVTPSVIVIILISRFLEKFRDSAYVERAFSGIRPVVTGLIAFVGIGVIGTALTGAEGGFISGQLRIKETILFVIMAVTSRKVNIHPVFYIAAAAVAGIVFSF